MQLICFLRNVGDAFNYLTAESTVFLIPLSFQDTFFPLSLFFSFKYMQVQKASGAMSFLKR